MAALLVTVGMGPYPFDRLLTAITPLCAYHDVFAQTGTSGVVPPCPHAPYVPLDEFRRRLTEADMVITHAGATVRLIQRLGRLPIAVPRLFHRGEAPDDSQTAFLRAEEQRGRVHAVWETEALPDAVAAHPRHLLSPLPPPTPADEVRAVMAGICARLLDGRRL
jgi:UDP-N-acetylglucosamine transferase subunit ALG13